jgi:hypothetical protein
MAEKSIDEEIKEIQLQTARLNLERDKEALAKFRADEAVRHRNNKQRQAQLQSDRSTKLAQAARCKHKQGGDPKSPLEGDAMADSALYTMKMPDILPGGMQTIMIKCLRCPLRVFTPHPSRASKKLREGETRAQMEARVAEYQKDLKEFDRLMEESRKKKSPESREPMDCGVTISGRNDDGEMVFWQRPCDVAA